MDVEAAKILKISDLIHRARPLTGTDSLASSRVSTPKPSDQPPYPSKPISENANPKILKPLNHPAILIGTLNLPSHFNQNAKSTIQCSCFQFADGSATICCDILNFDPEMIGKTIHISAWNFVPLKRAADYSGYLEIIRWEYLQWHSESTACSVSLGLSIDNVDNSKAKYSTLGVLESVSPLSVVPFSTGGSSSKSDSRNLCGFLLKILACNCELCRRKDSRMELQDFSVDNCKDHCFFHPLTVYFCGSTSSWHPFVLRLIGNVVSLRGLKKKLVYVGKEEAQVMFVATNKSSFHLSKFGKKWISNENITKIKGLGKVSSYTGTVTGIYMQGMVVELDEEVLLLLTDHQLLVPHSLRVGAIVTATNVHFVNPKFAWTRVLILGACFITRISVESFSPLEKGCYIKSNSENLLRKLVESLNFAARLWVLLTVTCLRKKFAGIFSEKEILGSKHKEGLAQTYITSHLPLSVFRFRHGVFMEYCKHSFCACGNEEDCSVLKLVVPNSYLISHCETRWMKMLMGWDNDIDIMGVSQTTSIVCCGTSYAKLRRRIFHSKDIYVILLGNLKVSSSSGRLQMVDATGSIDVIIPDIPSTWDSNAIYEIEDFTIIMQEPPHKPVQLDLSSCEWFGCQNIFRSAQFEKNAKVSLYIYYNFSNQRPRDDMYPPCLHRKGSTQEPEGGKFHLLKIEHKFPLLHELLGDQTVSNWSSLFAEAIVLPWDLSFIKNDEVAYLNGPSFSRLRSAMKLSSGGNFEEDVTLKRCKTDETASESLHTGLCDTGQLICGPSNSSYCSSSCSEGKHGGLSNPLKFPCLISGRGFKRQCQVFWHCTDRKAITSSCCDQDGRKVLLEFDSESLNMYQGLKIGASYIIKHQESDVLCTTKDARDLASCIIQVTSKTHLWSLLFSADEVLKNSHLSSIFPFFNSFDRRNEEFPDASQQFQSLPLMFTPLSPGICSDMTLFMPADVLSFLKVERNVLQSHKEKPCASLDGEMDIYTGNGVYITAPQLSSKTSHSNILLPEGNLVTLHGSIVAIHKFHHDSFLVNGSIEGFGNIHQSIISQGTSSICIHVLLGHHPAQIFCAYGHCVYPTGFGEGVDATFHRVLVIGVASVGAFHTALISEIAQSMDFEQIQLRCRVITLYILVLEKRRSVYGNIRIQPWLPILDVPLAGLIMDDGSSPCCCWADCERAATLLGLHFLAISHEAYVGTSQRSQTALIENDCASAVGRLNKILRRHDRVIVKNYGSIFDSSGLDLTFSVGSDETLTGSDEDFLRCLIVNACFSTLWTIVGGPMDSTAIHRLEKRLTELEMTMLPMENIWTCGVHHVDPGTETRQIIEELMSK